ncbi:MAG: hypothetical protein KC733_03885, partial [Candidatus Omnitrophica bacterium]|nr:hypothetical protein [Candidatus Omnitrophota bacterium]
SGVFFVLSYFSCIFYLLFSAFKYQHERYSNLTRKVSIFFICYIPSFLIVSYVENMASYIVIHWYLWGMMAVLISAQALEREQKILELRRARLDSTEDDDEEDD